jgi:hypothetical protein
MNCNLESVERRYGWLFRHLKEFYTRFETVFPDYWGVDVYLVYEFIGLTRMALNQILENWENPDVAVLMNALK